jgi:hypothetical protein
MPEGELILYRQGSHNRQYQEFEELCKKEGIAYSHFTEYGLTPEKAAAVLQPKSNDRKRRKNSRKNGRQPTAPPRFF